MKGIRSKAFLDVWRTLYHATNPGSAKDRWRVNGVDWTRETHTFRGRDYSFRIEGHTLHYAEKGRPAWSLLVVVEWWWGPDRTDTVRSAEWRRLLEGNEKQVLSWFNEQRDRIDRRSEAGP